jgi:uncharacterized Zn-binding protein involved in type VI secretion
MPNTCPVFASGTVSAIIINTGAPSVLVEGKPISLVGDQVAPHGEPPHSSSFVVNGSASVFAEGRPITLVGSGTTCGHPITFGSATVFAGF